MIEVKHLENTMDQTVLLQKLLMIFHLLVTTANFMYHGSFRFRKSTLLNCLSTIDCASAGDILFNGVSFDSLKNQSWLLSVAIISVLFSELQFAGYPYFRREYIFKFTHQRCCSRHNPKAHS